MADRWLGGRALKVAHPNEKGMAKKKNQGKKLQKYSFTSEQTLI